MRLLFWLNKKRLKKSGMQKMVMLGIALSTACLLITLSVAQGFEKEFTQALLNFYAHVTLQPDPAIVLPEAEVRQALEKIGVKEYTLQPFLFREALIVHEGKVHAVVLKGIPGLASFHLGAELAKRVGLGVIKLLLPNNQTVKLEASDIFRTGLYELDSQFALVDLDQLRKLFGLHPTMQGYEIKLPDPHLAQTVAFRLAEALPPFLNVQNWADDNRPLLEAFQLEKWFFRLLVGFMILVSLLNIVGAICLSIFHHKRWIAILQALGFSPQKVRTVFALEGFWLGMAGVGLGMLLGSGLYFSLKKFQWLSIDPQVYFLQKLPVDFSSLDGLILIFLSLFLAVVISWAAAGRIAAVSIREGLQTP